MLNLLAEEIEPTTGEIVKGPNVDLAYYAQHQLETLDERDTVYESIEKVALGMKETEIRTYLGGFLFSGEEIEKKVKVLSGGEKARLSLCGLLLSQSNVIILDEPTNHLSIKETNKVLDFVAGLKEQGVTSIFITHNLNHVFPIADHLCVMARGEKIADLQKENTDIQELTNLLVNG